jgi:HNH endonuclease
MSFQERFWQKVKVVYDPNSCWLWQAAKVGGGYGRIATPYGLKIATHALWFLIYGKWPRKHLLHRCDNPSCIRPSHLFEGTQLDNVRDCERKERALHPHGSKNGRAKLTEAQVRAIRKEYTEDRTHQVVLARRYHVAQSSISSILRREHWSYT